MRTGRSCWGIPGPLLEYRASRTGQTQSRPPESRTEQVRQFRSEWMGGPKCESGDHWDNGQLYARRRSESWFHFGGLPLWKRSVMCLDAPLLMPALTRRIVAMRFIRSYNVVERHIACEPQNWLGETEWRPDRHRRKAGAALTSKGADSDSAKTMILLKRAYDPASPKDGRRVLVKRLGHAESQRPRCRWTAGLKTWLQAPS